MIWRLGELRARRFHALSENPVRIWLLAEILMTSLNLFFNDMLRSASPWWKEDFPPFWFMLSRIFFVSYGRLGGSTRYTYWNFSRVIKVCGVGRRNRGLWFSHFEIYSHRHASGSDTRFSNVQMVRYRQMWYGCNCNRDSMYTVMLIHAINTNRSSIGLIQKGRGEAASIERLCTIHRVWLLSKYISRKEVGTGGGGTLLIKEEVYEKDIPVFLVVGE